MSREGEALLAGSIVGLLTTQKPAAFIHSARPVMEADGVTYSTTIQVEMPSGTYYVTVNEVLPTVIQEQP